MILSIPGEPEQGECWSGIVTAAAVAAMLGSGSVAVE